MRKHIVVAAVLALLTSCDSKELETRLRAQESEIKQLKTEVAELKQKHSAAPEHHYELRNVAFRTFRFDSATGETCIQLTTPDDWKRKETKAQSCECTDSTARWLTMPKETEVQRQTADFEYNFRMKPACGL